MLAPLKLQLVSESCVQITFAHRIELTNIALIKAAKEKIAAVLGDAFCETIQSYTALSVVFDPCLISPMQVMHRLQHIDFDQQEDCTSRRLIELPAYYHSEVAPDLISVATRLEKSVDEVIALHSNNTYHVYALGFSPGFAFMGEVDSALQLPRLATPRTSVPAGSVAIAEKQTAVYPMATPGGWHILARCPVTLFDVQKTPASLLQVGDQVRFKPVCRDEYLALGGRIDD